MSTPAKHHGIIVGVDGSAASNAAVSWAAREAAMRNIPLGGLTSLLLGSVSNAVVHSVRTPVIVARPS